MTNIKKSKILCAFEKKLIKRYSMISKLLILLTFVFVLWFLILLMGIYIWNYESDWAVIGFKNWILIMSVLISLFILLNIGLYLHLKSIDKKRIKEEKPKPEFIKGKRVLIYTYPDDSKGGIFSKTYISIDENNVLRLRLLMIKPDELWGKE
jgi:hypothetical protein